MDSYLVPAKIAQAEFVEKRSRFIGQLWPVATETEARSQIAETKKRYHDARHNCWCYLLRDGPVRYSDDGEPQGTAGQPMLHVFQAAGVANFCCVVTRYFGGILLGAGGLVRAYAQAAKLALDASGTQRVRRWTRMELDCPYPLYERAVRFLEAQQTVIEDTNFAAAVTLTIRVPDDAASAFPAALTERFSGNVTARPLGIVDG